jgi:hypothetical protein
MLDSFLPRHGALKPNYPQKTHSHRKELNKSTRLKVKSLGKTQSAFAEQIRPTLTINDERPNIHDSLEDYSILIGKQHMMCPSWLGNQHMSDWNLNHNSDHKPKQIGHRR